MRRAVAMALVGLLAHTAWLDAGTQRAPLSPRGTVDATIDGVHVTMEYGRPSKRGREIWGGLVPWGRWWMPGADEATSIVTSGPLMVGPLMMPAGTHTVYTLPGDKIFTLIINNQTGQFHTVYHPDRDLGRVPMRLTMLPDMVEQMTFRVVADAPRGGALSLQWDDREYSVPLSGVVRQAALGD